MTPLHPKVAELITQLTTIITTTQKLMEIIVKREVNIAEAVLELQKEEPNKAKILDLLK